MGAGSIRGNMAGGAAEAAAVNVGNGRRHWQRAPPPVAEVTAPTRRTARQPWTAVTTPTVHARRATPSSARPAVSGAAAASTASAAGCPRRDTSSARPEGTVRIVPFQARAGPLCRSAQRAEEGRRGTRVPFHTRLDRSIPCHVGHPDEGLVVRDVDLNATRVVCLVRERNGEPRAYCLCPIARSCWTLVSPLGRCCSRGTKCSRRRAISIWVARNASATALRQPPRHLPPGPWLR